MKHLTLGTSSLQVPAVAMGCMRLWNISVKETAALIDTALENGCNFFEHADIYGDGKERICEKIFLDAIQMTPAVREQIILQSKCGIIPGVMYDFSKEHILEAVDGSLRRLNTDHLDVLLLHRPDPLVEPEEVAEAFDILEASGKVRHFGVSNHKPAQIELLKKYVKQTLIADQLQFSIVNSGMVQNGIETNMTTPGAVDRDDSVLDYCRLHDITIQTWSPFQYGFIEGYFVGSDKYPKLNQVLDELAEKYEVSAAAIAAAWIMRHPAKMQIIAGTTKPAHLKEIFTAADITLTREEWYRLYLAADHILP